MSRLTSRPKLRVPALLDEYGRELGPSRLRRQVAADNPRGMQTFNAHPAIGLTVEALLSYYRLAEDGAPTRMMDMFDDLLERYPEARGMFAERNEDVAGCDFAVLPPLGRDDKPSRIAADALNEVLQGNGCFRKHIEHQLTAVPFGYACTNLVWDSVDKLIIPTDFELVAQRRFAAPSATRAHELWLIDGDKSTFDLIELTAGLWSCTFYYHRNPFAAGLMRSCAWWILFALTGFKQFQIFADMFGMPMAIGYYEEGSGGASRAALEDAVKAIGQDGYAVLSNLTEMVIKETARGGDSSTVYPQIMKICAAQLTMLITGGTLNTDVSSTGAGSYNAATVHESRAFKMKRRDATRFEASFSESIGQTFVAWNGFDRAAPPRIKMKIARDELQRAQTLEILGQAVPLSKAQIYEEFNLREPSGPDDEVKFSPTDPPDPGHAREDKRK